MPEPPQAFAYSNLSDRAPGRLVTVAGWVLPGVARVQAQVAPYARAWQDANAAALMASGPLWVALGDSMTQGIGAPAHDRGWVGQLRHWLSDTDRSWRVVNLAVSGARTTEVLERQLPALEALGVAPDLVTVMIGSNDLMRAGNRAGLTERVGQIMQRIPATAAVCTLPNPSRAATAANEVIERVSAERGITIVELREPSTGSWRGKLAADHFHPNERGYAALAARFADALSARFGTL